ncbi:MAG: aspartate aminotransferase family protein [Bacteroidetes bacterium]|nr:aspartate aminotransferase family protein [Bacteroidota bacterium]
MSEYKIPEKGIDKALLLEQLKTYGSDDKDWKNGKVWSLVYHLDDEHSDFMKTVYTSYFSENGLNPVAFKSLKRFEHETVRMTLDMLHGGTKSVGNMTSGGTGSITIAIKCYRDYFLSKRKLIKGVYKFIQPEMILPASAHPAFRKAAQYFGVKVVEAPLDKNFRVDVKAVKRLINLNTMLIVGSAPCYPYGVIDPIEDLGKLAKRRNIPLHVDACVGGFILPFVEALGYPIPAFDFRVEGVTSMSADIHKYGYAAKGASLILYRSMDIMKHQFFIDESWCGGIYISPSLQGTKPGGAIASAWAALKAIGREGYMTNAKLLMELTQSMVDGINAIDGLEVMGHPEVCLIGFRSSDKRKVNIFVIGDLMEKKGWHIDRQQNPNSLHISLNPTHEFATEEYLKDLKDCVAHAKAHPELKNEGDAAMYGMVAKIPLRGMIKKELMSLMEEMYGPEGKMPDNETQDEKNDIVSKLARTYIEWAEKLESIFSK